MYQEPDKTQHGQKKTQQFYKVENKRPMKAYMLYWHGFFGHFVASAYPVLVIANIL